MKGSLLHIVLACLPLAAVAAPSRPFLQLQADGTHLLTIAEETLPSVKIDIPNTIKDLSVDDFVTIQESIKHSLSDAKDALIEAVVGTFDATAEEVAPPPHHGPPPPHGSQHGILDFSNYTILEIFEAALHKHNHSSSDTDIEAAEDAFWKFPFPGHRGPPHKPTPAHLPLHRLAWLVNASSEAKASLGKAENVTLLAPTDWALTPPHRRRHRAHKKAEMMAGDVDEEGAMDLEMVMQEAQMESEEQPVQHPFYSSELMGLEEGPKDRKKLFSKIIGWVINYHTIPDITCTYGLASHSTVATALAPSGEPLRISVEPTWTLFPIPHPSIKFNYYSFKKGYTIKAKNGVIHLVSAPLLPPLTPLNKAFLFPSFFSILTNAVQKVGLDEKILPSSSLAMAPENEQVDMVKDVMDELTKELKGQWTIFAPTNWAFEKLGLKVLALLHSPFPISRKVLKYVLAYHLVPDIAFYSDYINNATSISPYITKVGIDVDVPMSWIEDVHSVELDGGVSESEWKMPKIPKMPLPKKPSDDHPPPPHHPHPHHKANVTHYQLPTLLATSGVNPNATLEVVVVEYRVLGKGPKRRSVIVLPAEHGHGHSHSEEDVQSDSFERERDGKKKCKKGKKGPAPVKVWKKDVVARNGAIQVLGTLLRPPYYHHNSTSSSAAADHSSTGHRKHDEMGWALSQLFD